MASTKLKTLLVYKLLNDYSDENHPLSTPEIIDMLKDYGITCERKSIYADVKQLNDVGFDIVSTKSKKRGFFVGSRQFELAEVRLLIDAVSSAGFITPKKSKDLIKKLETLVSKNQANELVSQVYIDSDTKCDNEDIYYTIDSLHSAILEGKKVRFEYKRRNIDKENVKNYTTKIFTVSPYAMIWRGDHYYLICNNEKYDNLMNLRLDRIRRVYKINEVVRPMSEVSEYSEKFDAADYVSKSFNMFSGAVNNVKLQCNLDLREEIMDRFGSKIPLKAIDSNHFETTIPAAVSDGLVSWIMNFGNKIKVVEPQSLAAAVKERAIQIAQNY